MKSKLLLSLGLIATLGMFQTKAMEHLSDYERAKAALRRLPDKDQQAILNLSPSDWTKLLGTPLKAVVEAIKFYASEELRRLFGNISANTIDTVTIDDVLGMPELKAGDDSFSLPHSSELRYGMTLGREGQVALLSALLAGVFEGLSELNLSCEVEENLLAGVEKVLEGQKCPSIKRLAIGSTNIMGITEDEAKQMLSDSMKRQMNAILKSKYAELEELGVNYEDAGEVLAFALAISEAKEQFPKLKRIYLGCQLSNESFDTINKTLEKTGVLIYWDVVDTVLRVKLNELEAKWKKMHANDAE